VRWPKSDSCPSLASLCKGTVRRLGLSFRENFGVNRFGRRSRSGNIDSSIERKGNRRKAQFCVASLVSQFQRNVLFA
jgi:hypothetical protein